MHHGCPSLSLLSWTKIVRGVVLLLKVVVVAAVAWWILGDRVGEVARLGESNLAAALAGSWAIVIRLAMGMRATLLAIGVLDYAWQRWQFELSICMTRQEVKEEVKRDEGDPQIKA